MFYVFRELRIILGERKLRIVFKTITEPIVSYGLIGWGGACQNVLKSLQTNRNTLLRITLNMDFTTHRIDLFNNFYVLSVKKIYYNFMVTYLKET